jgi:hypothetical protein
LFPGIADAWESRADNFHQRAASVCQINLFGLDLFSSATNNFDKGRKRWW